MASGINFVFRRTWPLISGVVFGFPFMIGCIGLGLGKIFEIYPIIYTVMKYAGATSMLWLAWKIATAAPVGENDQNVGQPVSFLQACALQWINPKGWVIALTELSAYTIANNYYVGVAIIVAKSIVVGIAGAAAWAMFGVGLKHVLNDARYLHKINWALGFALAASVIPMLRH
jgi:threonine/homoserine/homoserine lactone efflux protein